MKWTSWLPALGLVLAVLVRSAAADPAADPYAVTPEAGAWMICAASYMGEEAPSLAHKLVEQLRAKHRLPAYVFNRGDDEKRKDEEEHKKKEAALGGVHLPFRHPRYTEQCAVLIGGYPDMQAANAALLKVKKLPAPDLKLSTGAPALDLEYYREPSETNKEGEVKRAYVNPFTRSFVTRNPTAPQQQAAAPKVDPIWKELNSGEDYSLLKNPKPWTLAVKEYVGTSVIAPRGDSSTFLDKLRTMGRKPGEGLSAAGLQAHALAEVLRGKTIGFDSYVLHTRTSSIVTVGAFNGPDDPELQRVQRRLTSLSFSGGKGSVNGDPIKLFAVPVPMEVPRF